MCIDELLQLDRPAGFQEQPGAEIEVILVFQADWDDVHGHFVFQPLPGAERDACDAFFQGEEAVHRPVPPFRQDAEGDAVAEGVDALFHDGVVFRERLDPVADPVDRQHLEEAERLADRRFLEDVGAGDEDDRILAGGQDDQRVHQGIGVVRGEDDGTVARNGVEIPVFDLAVCHRDRPAGIAVQGIVEHVLFLDLTHGRVV